MMIMSPGLPKIFRLFFYIFIFYPNLCLSEPIKNKTAILNLLDKTANKVSKRFIDINTSENWGSLNIYIYACYSNPPDEIPENYVLLDVIDQINEKKESIYKGWMISSSPNVTPLEHPVYDLWLDDCE